MVVRPGAVGAGVGGNQFRSPNQAVQAAGVLLGHHFPVQVENKPHQISVLLHLIAQALGVIAVELDMAAKGLHLLRTVEGVIAVAGLVVHQQVAGVVVLEHGGDPTLGVGGQPVPGVVLVQLLHTAGDPARAVARLVVEQLLGVGGILHLFQLVQRVIVIEGITSKLTLQRPVAVAVIEILVFRQQLPAGLDKQAGEILVLELPLDRTVGLRADGAVGVVLIRRQPVPIFLLRSHFSKRASKSQAGMDAPPMSWRHRRRFWTYLL